MNSDEQGRMQKGREALARAVASTLGPAAREVVIEKGGRTLIATDGATVARELVLADEMEMAGARLLGQAAIRTYDAVGDGTATAVVLAQAMLAAARAQRAEGADLDRLKRGLDQAIRCVVGELDQAARLIKSKEELQTFASNLAGIPLVGEILADAMDKVGKDGLVTVGETDSVETTLDVIEGMHFGGGYLTPSFVTDAGEEECVLENACILVYEKPISTAQEMVPFLERVAAARRPLLVIAGDVTGEALATMVANNNRKSVRCCAVKVPHFGDSDRAALEDIAVLTGGVCFGAEPGAELSGVAVEHLGRATRVVVTREDTTIVEGGGKPRRIQERIEDLRDRAARVNSDPERGKLLERLCRLAGGHAVIRMGASGRGPRGRAGGAGISSRAGDRQAPRSRSRGARIPVRPDQRDQAPRPDLGPRAP